MDPQDERTTGALLLTGATGFIGGEVLARLLERGNRRVYALVRADDDDAAAARLATIVRGLIGSDEPCGERVIAVRGDIEQPDLGISAEHGKELTARVTDVVHIASSVAFRLPLERARAINVEGTRHTLDFAAKCSGIRRFSDVSTAYVAGTHRGEFGEDDLDVGQKFHNTYEQSKFEAESLVRSFADRFPIQVFRPSIVVGESTSGWTNSFNVMYTPLKALQRHRIRAVPARGSAPVDIVPVDFVADAIVELVERPDQGRDTYHLVAGSDATTVAEFLELAAGRLGKRKPPLIPPPLYYGLLRPLILWRSSPKQREALRKARAYAPYFRLRLRYDDTHARERLGRSGIAVSPIADYFDRLIDFAVRAEWGKREIPRAEAHSREDALAPADSA